MQENKIKIKIKIQIIRTKKNTFRLGPKRELKCKL